MKRFFSFRSSTASSRKDDPMLLCPNTENTSWETPLKNITKEFAHEEILKRSQTNEELAISSYQRSASFLSPTCYSYRAEGNSFLSDLSGSTSNDSCTLHQNVRVPVKCASHTQERFHKLKRNNDAAICKADTIGKPDLHSSYGNHQCSAQMPPYSSPVLLRCRSAREAQISDKSKTIDIYVDGEQQKTRYDKDYKQPSRTGNYCCQAENRVTPGIGCPPRFLHTAPNSPNYSKENLRSCSFREEKCTHRCVFIQDHARDDIQPLTPQRYARKIIQKLTHVHPGKPKAKMLDYDTETTTTIEDVCDDTSNIHYRSSPNSPAQNHALLDQKHVPVHETADVHCREEGSFLQRQTYFPGDGSLSSKLESSLFLEEHEEKLDRELLRKLKETEERISLIPEMDLYIEKLQNGSLCVSALAQTLGNFLEDWKDLKSELSFQLRCRIAERSSMKEALWQAKLDLDIRKKMHEKEKNELQSYLENELDRWSGDWLLKIESLQAEEHRLRVRMREVAEENVSFQREVSFLNGREIEARSRMMDSELQCDYLTTRLEEARNENEKLHQALSELQECCDGAKADRDCIGRTYKEKEKENKELQKAVVRLQRICNEQEKTITGLRQGFSDEIMKQSSGSGELVTKLQNDQVRLAGVEQKLRREVESYRFEVESLRHENIHLLERLQVAGNSCGTSFFRLDQELHARIDCLKNQGLSLLDNSSELCAKLLEFVEGKQCDHEQEAADKFSVYLVMEYGMKLRSLRKAVETLRRSLLVMSMMVDEKSTAGVSGHQLPNPDSGLSRHLKSEASASSLDDMEYELKAETLLNSVLREKLCYKELELEQLQAELSTSVLSNEILKSEIQRLQDDLSSLRHKTKQMELQMLKKDDNLNQLQSDLQGYRSELTIVRGLLPKISDERDHLWEEVKQLNEINMLLEHEVKSLNKKIETLDEDVLIKEGQITMLKDRLQDNPFAVEFSFE